MKYETPELVALPSAVNAIQTEKAITKNSEGLSEVAAAYEDWE